jgi:putative membrane protein
MDGHSGQPAPGDWPVNAGTEGARSHAEREHHGNAALGIVAGLIGGAVGTWAMSQVQALWSQAAEGFESPSACGRHDARDWQERNEGQNANELAAQTVAAHTIDRPLTREELEAAAPLMHYAFGSVLGAVYGVLVEQRREVPPLAGATFGAAVWIGADEIAMPALGLARRDVDYPMEAHLQSFAAHIVYGVTTDLVRRGLRAII